MPNYRQLFTDAQRQQAIADGLLQNSVQSHIPQQQGRIASPMGLGHGLTQLAKALVARKTSKNASASMSTAEESRRQAQAEALGGMSRPPNMVELPERQNPYARAQNALEADVDPNVVGSYLKAQNPEVGAEPASLAGYRQAKSEGYAGTYTDYKKEFEGREANVPAALQVWKLYQSLSPEDRAAFVESQRNVPIETINQVPTRIQAGGVQQPLSTLPSEANAKETIAAAQAAGTTSGTAQATAAAGLPQAEQTAQTALETVQQLRTHPGRAMATGATRLLQTQQVPGTPAYDFDTLRKQAAGQVFLNAYQQLKGAGVITEIEGVKAEQAIARMDAAQSDDAFLESLTEYEGIINRGVETARRRAGLPPGSPTNPQGSTEFATEAEAEAAAKSGALKPGTRVKIGGVSGVWQ